MKRGKTENLANILNQFLENTALERGLQERQVVRVVYQTLGQLGSQYLRKVEVRGGVLYLHLTSAALRQELYMSRMAFIERINVQIGRKVVQELRVM
ncbi:MAG: DUF721 domain-containing protein [Paludibacteraceae bacterium]|nr:DUF721 domain-containing protein [Paludibacteraceae bacterium]MBO7234665.1 DUF721 domain-containing protein [Paludibacteraceae bacterium]MBO7259409.1 DUF721 domain-containing protein [Paludibacteraceae bacterium]